VFGWLKRRRRAAKAAALMPEIGEFEALCARTPCLARLDPGQRERLRNLTGLVLADKSFHGAGGLQPEWVHCMPVAAHAALPVLELGIDWYAHFRTVILYADAFEVEIEELDEDGLLHRGRDLRAGEAWYRGPVVLSLSDVADSGMGDGYHVVVHEMAHQIDQLSGDADGFPPLHADIAREEWSSTFQQAYARLQRRVEADGHTDIDPYAAESPGEFFAVTAEYFFDAPQVLRTAEPGVYRMLSKFFRQDPADGRVG
jgi:hypothetical protein